VAPLANLVVVPLSSLVLAAGLVAAAGPALAPTFPFVQLAGMGARLLLDANGWFAGLPGAWQRCPTPPAWWVAAGLIAAFVWSFHAWRRMWIPVSTVILILLWLGRGPEP